MMLTMKFYLYRFISIFTFLCQCRKHFTTLLGFCFIVLYEISSIYIQCLGGNCVMYGVSLPLFILSGVKVSVDRISGMFIRNGVPETSLKKVVVCISCESRVCGVHLVCVRCAFCVCYNGFMINHG